MTTFRSDPAVLDLHLEPLFDGDADREDPLPTSVANPRRTTWTGYASTDADRLASY